MFVDGCFWHGCPEHYTRPRSGSSFWSNKLAANVERDRRHTLALELDGWRVVRVWEHDVWSDLERAVEGLRSARDNTEWKPPTDWRVVRVDAAPGEGDDWERRELELLRDPAVSWVKLGPRNTAGEKNAWGPR